MKLLFDENNLTAVITQLADGTYRADIPEIDGISAEGNTEEEAEELLMDKLRVIKLMAKNTSLKKQLRENFRS